MNMHSAKPNPLTSRFAHCTVPSAISKTKSTECIHEDVAAAVALWVACGVITTVLDRVSTYILFASLHLLSIVISNRDRQIMR